MKLMLTSFGLDHAGLDQIIGYPEMHVHPGHMADVLITRTHGDPRLFHRMPPVSMRNVLDRQFSPDFSALLLCDKLVLDHASYYALQDRPHSTYNAVSDALVALKEEGFVELVDFAPILERNKPLLREVLSHDLKRLEQWIEPLKESIALWDSFCRKWGSWLGMRQDQRLHGYLDAASELRLQSAEDEFQMAAILMHHQRGELGIALHQADLRKKENRGALKDILGSYLAYCNANLLLSNQLGVGFYDWADYTPFYRHKFLSVAMDEQNEQKQINAARRLFDVSFPEFEIKSTSALLKVLQDRRVNDLRILVNEAVEGKVTFDEAFARSVFKEISGLEKTSLFRRITSWVTGLLNFIPGIGTEVELGAEVANNAADAFVKRKYRWFYLLSDVAEGEPE